MKGKKFIAIISIVCILAVILCIPAFATVSESNGDGYALYGGYYMPSIDDILSSVDHSFACISYTVLTNRHFVLYLGDINYSTDEDGSNVFGIIDYDEYRLNASGVWEYFGSGDYVRITSIDSDWKPILPYWASSDIIRPDGTIYYDSTAPISLDGYIIIEWDGDITGLEPLGTDEGFYKISPYVDVTSAFAVSNGVERYVQDDFLYVSPYWVISTSNLPGFDNGSTIVFANDGTDLGGASPNGIFALSNSDFYTSLIAYRTIEEPPGEGGDTPDEPQPPLWAADIYHKLHLFLLTPQLK